MKTKSKLTTSMIILISSVMFTGVASAGFVSFVAEAAARAAARAEIVAAEAAARATAEAAARAAARAATRAAARTEARAAARTAARTEAIDQIKDRFLDLVQKNQELEAEKADSDPLTASSMSMYEKQKGYVKQSQAERVAARTKLAAEIEALRTEASARAARAEAITEKARDQILVLSH